MNQSAGNVVKHVILADIYLFFSYYEGMEFRQLEYLVAVIDTGGFSRAAAQCYVSQSAISHQVAALEREAGPAAEPAVAVAVPAFEAQKI